MTTVQLHPVTFSEFEVREALRGGTMSILRDVQLHGYDGLVDLWSHEDWRYLEADSKDGFFKWQLKKNIKRCLTEQPPFNVGDRLWVRETWLEMDSDQYREPGKPREHLLVLDGVRYRNGCSYLVGTDAESDDIRRNFGYSWVSPASMPQWASRLSATVVDVQVRQLKANLLPIIGYEQRSINAPAWCWCYSIEV